MEIKGFTAADVKRKFAQAEEYDAIVNGVKAPEHKGIMLEGQVVGVVGRKYQLVQNAEYFGTVEKAMLEAIPPEMQKGHICRTISTGNWTKREHIFPEYKGTVGTSKRESKMGLRIIATNSYDGSSSAKMMAGLIDFYCTNGMVIGSDISSKARRHTSGLQVADFIEPLKVAISAANSGVEWLQKLAEKPIENDPLMAFLEKNFSGRRAAEMLARIDVERQDRGDNLFAIHSALTYYSSHAAPEEFSVRGENPSPRILEAREDHVQRALASREWRALEAA